MVTVTETNPRCSELEDVEGGVTRKKVLALLALGIVGTVLVRQYQKQKGDRFANGDIPAPGGKNFGMFPPEIPEEQFEGSLCNGISQLFASAFLQVSAMHLTSNRGS